MDPLANMIDLGQVVNPAPVDMEKCNRCNICVENCPTGSINLSTIPPVDKDTCIFCKVCEQICPLGAIEIDYAAIVADHKKNWGENHQQLNFFTKAIARTGQDPRFRRLVPLEDVGRDGYWYQISKHPRIRVPK